MAVTRLDDLVIPENFMRDQIITRTMQKSALVQSGLLTRSEYLNGFLAGQGLTTTVPSFNDLSGEERVSNDDPESRIPKDGTGTPPNAHRKISTNSQVAVRLERNQSWSDMDIAAALAIGDPLGAIADLTSDYWMRRMQAALIATVQGVFADNDAAPSGGDTHTQGDMTIDIKGGGYVAGVTDFNAESFDDALTTMGDASGEIVAVGMHSHVFSRAKKNNLIDFIPDAINPAAAAIPTYLGKRVIVDDGIPNPAGTGAAATATGIYHTWLFGRNSFLLGTGSPENATEVSRDPESGNGSGQSILWNRVRWCLHPRGHAWIGTASMGGPENGDASTANTLAHAASWRRVFPERKQIPIARLITRES